MCGVFGDECLSEHQCRNWFTRFYSGKFDVNNKARPGQLIVKKVKEILQKLEIGRYISSCDIAAELNVVHKAVLNHLHLVTKVSRHPYFLKKITISSES